MKSHSVRVLSVQTTLLGNRTYGELLRRAFANGEQLTLDARWAPSPQTLPRGLRRLACARSRFAAVRTRNLDGYAARFELGASLAARAYVQRALRERAPDVLHLHAQGLALLAGGIARRVPTVISADMTARQAASQQLHPRWRWTYAPNVALEGRVLRAAAAVVVFSAWAGRAMIGEHRLAPERVVVVPPGVERERFDALLRARETRACERVRRILFIGGEFARKGGPELIAAYRARFGDRDDVELHVVSGDPAAGSSHGRVVVHRGVTPWSREWKELYASAHVFALPTHGDASPHVVVEAMAAGIPVVSTPVGAIPEMLGSAGIVVAPDDPAALAGALAALVDDASLRERMAAAGLARVAERYDATTNARMLARVFAGAAARGAEPLRAPAARPLTEYGR